MKWQWPWVSRRRRDLQARQMRDRIRGLDEQLVVRGRKIRDLESDLIYASRERQTLMASREEERHSFDAAREELKRSLAASRREAQRMRSERDRLYAVEGANKATIAELRATLARVSKPAAKTRYAPPAAKGRAS